MTPLKNSPSDCFDGNQTFKQSPPTIFPRIFASNKPRGDLFPITVFRERLIREAITQENRDYLVSHHTLSFQEQEKQLTEPAPLIIIDMQERFLSVDVVVDELVTDVQATLARILANIRQARATNMPIFIVELERFGPTIEPILEALSGYKQVFHLTKNTDSAMATPQSADELKQRLQGYKLVRVSGLNEGACVLATILDIVRELNISVVVNESDTTSVNIARAYREELVAPKDSFLGENLYHRLAKTPDTWVTRKPELNVYIHDYTATQHPSACRP